MGVVVSHLSVDAADPQAQAAWWSAVLGWRVTWQDDAGDEAATEPPDASTPGLLFLRVPEGKSVKNRLHLDIRPQEGSSQATELGRLLALGARTADVGQGPDVPWVVLADPEGNEFCLLRRTPSEAAEAAEEAANRNEQRHSAGEPPAVQGG